jgi:hypothetical protein
MLTLVILAWASGLRTNVLANAATEIAFQTRSHDLLVGIGIVTKQIRLHDHAWSTGATLQGMVS